MKASRILVYGPPQEEIARLRKYLADKLRDWDITIISGQDPAHIVKMIKKRKIDMIHFTAGATWEPSHTAESVEKISMAIRRSSDGPVHVIILRREEYLLGRFASCGIRACVVENAADLVSIIPQQENSTLVAQFARIMNPDI